MFINIDTNSDQGYDVVGNLNRFVFKSVIGFSRSLVDCRL